MPITIRTFPSQSAALDFYNNQSNMWNRDERYNQLYPAGTGVTGTQPNVTNPSTPTTPGVGSLPGSATNYDPVAGGKPTMPDPLATARTAIGGNMQNLTGGGTDLANYLNQFNLGQVTNQYLAGIPDYNNMVTQSSRNIGSLLRGEVPQDVRNVLSQGAAERGVMLGVPGSQFSNYDFLRSLGQTSLGLQQTGEQNLTGAISRMPRTNIFDPASLFVTPEQMQNAQFWSNLLASGPVPRSALDYALSQANTGLATGIAASQLGGSNYNPYRSGILPYMGTSGPTIAPIGGGANYLPVIQPPQSTVPGTFGGSSNYTVQGAPTYDPNINPEFDPFQYGQTISTPGADYNVPTYDQWNWDQAVESFNPDTGLFWNPQTNQPSWIDDPTNYPITPIPDMQNAWESPY